jgi:prepilin-type N-terminal cleavage/methylation domain-containing protein
MNRHPIPTSPRRRGFTLTELLIAIAIIVLILAISIPAFSFITGRRSVEAGVNQASALVARARTESIGRQQSIGVAFYPDAVSGRFAFSIVEAKNPQPWQPDVIYSRGDYVFTGTTTPRYYVALQAHTSTAANDPNSAPALWREISDATDIDAITQGRLLDISDARDTLQLPIGIGVTGIADAPTANEVYLPFGVIVFDPAGRLIGSRYRISGDGLLGELVNAGNPTPAGWPSWPPSGPGYRSAIGLMFYERQAFPQDGQPVASWNFPAARAWIDENALPVLVNRYNGTLVKGQ